MLFDVEGGGGGERGEIDAEGVAGVFEPAVAVGLAEAGEDGVVDGDDGGGVDVFDVFGGVGDFRPRGGNGDGEDFGVLDRGFVKRVAGVGKNAVDDNTEVVARNLPLDNRGVGLAEELEAETAYLPGFAGTDDDGAADERSGVWGGKDRGGGILGEKIADDSGLAVVIVLMSDDDSMDVAKEVSGEFFGEFDWVDENGIVVFDEGEARVFEFYNIHNIILTWLGGSLGLIFEVKCGIIRGVMGFCWAFGSRENKVH